MCLGCIVPIQNPGNWGHPHGTFPIRKSQRSSKYSKAQLGELIAFSCVYMIEYCQGIHFYWKAWVILASWALECWLNLFGTLFHSKKKIYKKVKNVLVKSNKPLLCDGASLASARSCILSLLFLLWPNALSAYIFYENLSFQALTIIFMAKKEQESSKKAKDWETHSSLSLFLFTKQ